METKETTLQTEKIKKLFSSLTPEDLIEVVNYFMAHAKLESDRAAALTYKNEHQNDSKLHDILLEQRLGLILNKRAPS